MLVGVGRAGNVGRSRRRPGLPILDFRAAMPASVTYARSSAAIGRTLAGALQTFAANQPQRTDAGLAIEPARTNLATYSTDASNAIWSASGGTKTSAIADPLGGTGAARFTANGASASHFLNHGESVSYVAGTTYTWSRLVKAETATRVQIVPPQSRFGAATYANFDLSTGTITATANGTAEIIALGNGWYLIALTATVTVTGAALSAGALGLIASGTSGVLPTFVSSASYLDFGAQVTVGGFVTSPIATGAAAATRALPAVTTTALSASARLTYADGTTSTSTGLTPGATFDVAAAVLAAGKGRFGASELGTLEWLG